MRRRFRRSKARLRSIPGISTRAISSPPPKSCTTTTKAPCSSCSKSTGATPRFATTPGATACSRCSICSAKKTIGSAVIGRCSASRRTDGRRSARERKRVAGRAGAAILSTARFRAIPANPVIDSRGVCMKSLRSIVVIGVAAALGLGACATDQYGNRRPLTDAQRGAIIGAATGAVVGGIASKNKKKGALIGAIGGGIAGTAVGAYMDRQKQDLDKVLAPERGAGAIQVEKLPGDIVRVTMTDQTAFDFDSAQIKPGFNSTMDKISDVVNRYGKTHLTVVGHTDNV